MIIKQFGMDAIAGSSLKAYADEGLLRTRIYNDLDSVKDLFDEKLEIRNRNFDFYHGNQWTEAEILAHAKQFREPYVFNQIQRIVDNLVGTQTQTRLDSRVVGREPGDDKKEEVLNYIIKWVEQVNEIEIVETEVYLESLVGGSAAAIVRWIMEDYNHGYPKIELVPIDELQWDLNSKKMDLSDARWMARIKYMRVVDALEIYPQYEEEITAADTETIDNNGYISTQKSDYQERVLQALSSSMGDEDRRIVKMVEYYERYKIVQYIVSDTIVGNIRVFDLKSDAEAYYSGLVEEYIHNGEVLINDRMQSKVMISVTTKDAIMQSIMAGDRILYTQRIDYPDFPYVVNFAYYHEGDYWSFVDQLISPQTLINRFLSQWDYQIGASPKNAMMVIESMLPRGLTIEDIRREASKTAPIFPVLNSMAIQPIPNQPINPELFQGIFFSIQHINDSAGGKNTLGLQENAAESGRAVIARAEQGGVGRLPLFDKLRIWRKNVMMRVVWLVKNYMPEDQILRIIGVNPDLQGVELDDMDIDSLKEMKVDIEIDEAQKSDTMKERNFMALKELFQVTQLPPEITIPLMLEYSSLPRAKRDEIIKQIEQQKQFVQQQAMQAQQQKNQQDVQIQEDKRFLRQLIKQKEQIQDTNEEIQEERQAGAQQYA